MEGAVELPLPVVDVAEVLEGLGEFVRVEARDVAKDQERAVIRIETGQRIAYVDITALSARFVPWMLTVLVTGL